MTSATTAIIKNGFVFVPASSFVRDDQGDESLAPHEIQHAYAAPAKMPSLTPEQQQMLRMAYDANITNEARGGVDGIYLDIQTAVQWGLIPAEPLPGDVHAFPTPRQVPANHVPQTTMNPQAANMKPSPTTKAVKKKARNISPRKPWERPTAPRLTPPGFE